MLADREEVEALALLVIDVSDFEATLGHKSTDQIRVFHEDALASPFTLPPSNHVRNKPRGRRVHCTFLPSHHLQIMLVT